MRFIEDGNRASNIISLESAKMPVYRSIQYRKSGQEVFDLLPAFRHYSYEYYLLSKSTFILFIITNILRMVTIVR